MSDIGLGLLALLVLALLLVALLRPRRGRAQPVQTLSDLPVEDLLPRHLQYFAQVRRALSAEDAQYLRDRASRRTARRALRARRAVVRGFLAGLLEDFERLERLGRTIAALSPVVNRRQEFERLWLGARFRMVYAVVQFYLALGLVSVPQLEALTNQVGSLARRLHEAMAALSAASAGGQSSQVSV